MGWARSAGQAEEAEEPFDYILVLMIRVTRRFAHLGRSFPSRYGAPVIRRVDLAIFRRTYFTHCLRCTYCDDACCDHGVDVDLWHARQIDRWADEIEAYTGISRERWFTAEVEQDPEVPGGATRRTQVEDGHCIFLNRRGRGCLLHSFCHDHDLDYHDLKSMVDCLFPLSFYEQTLCPADDVGDDSLICLDEGPTLYRGLRHELEYYFGKQFVSLLDEVEETAAGRTEGRMDGKAVGR
ncbi:MAG: hypothetical protein R3282_02600 [Rhodothermales bacterium]|nr:hypothetical protein [Rhodothermales bacterium]